MSTIQFVPSKKNVDQTTITIKDTFIQNLSVSRRFNLQKISGRNEKIIPIYADHISISVNMKIMNVNDGGFEGIFVCKEGSYFLSPEISKKYKTIHIAKEVDDHDFEEGMIDFHEALEMVGLSKTNSFALNTVSKLSRFEFEYNSFRVSKDPVNGYNVDATGIININQVGGDS